MIEKKPAQALLMFANSYLLAQHPMLLLLIGRSLHASGENRMAGEFCQRYLREQTDPNENFEAAMCRTAGIAAGSGEPLVDLNGLSLDALHDLNIADIHFILKNYNLSEKFADHFLAEAPNNSPARRYATHLLRTTRRFQGKSDLYANGPRPRSRIIGGVLAIGFGVALIAWGAAVLPVHGLCVGDLADPTLPPYCKEIYSTLKYGVPLVVGGGVTSAAGILTAAWPGHPPERLLTSLSESWLIPTLAFSF